MRVFLDANILFAAAWRPAGGCKKLLDTLAQNAAQLGTSEYAAQEAQRNIRKKILKITGSSFQEEEALDEVLQKVHLISNAEIPVIANHTNVPLKDWPIVEGAIAFGATHLLTGDKDHFGHYQNKKMHGVKIVFAADLWEQLQE